MKHFVIRGIILLAAFCFAAKTCEAFDFRHDNIYANDAIQPFLIKQFSSDGNYVDRLHVVWAPGGDMRGLAFGPDNLLYVVVANYNTFNVLAIDSLGTVHAVYTGPGYTYGNASYGHIAFAPDGRFYVAGGTYLVAFSIGQPNGIVVSPYAIDVAILPSGNLLVLSSVDLQELTPSGSLVREITPVPEVITYPESVTYDPDVNLIFLTMIGYTNHYHELMSIDGTSGEVYGSVVNNYANDIALTPDKRLIVVSDEHTARIYDEALEQLGEFNDQSYYRFVAYLQKPQVEDPGQCDSPPVDQEQTQYCLPHGK